LHNTQTHKTAVDMYGFVCSLYTYILCTFWHEFICVFYGWYLWPL